MGRPISWYKKITAPPEAIAFYKALAEAGAAGVFADCHVFDGALNKQGVPILLDPGSKKPLPAPIIIAAYLGEERTGSRMCKTEGCLNPFHYAPPGLSKTLFPGAPKAPEVDRDIAPIEEWVELVRYFREKNEVRYVTMAWLLKTISADDIPPELMESVFNRLPPEWKKPV